MERVIENNRMIGKIGDEKTKKAMETVKKEYEKN